MNKAYRGPWPLLTQKALVDQGMYQLRSHRHHPSGQPVFPATSITSMLKCSKSNLFFSKNEAILVNKISLAACHSRGITLSKSSQNHSPSKNQT